MKQKLKIEQKSETEYKEDIEKCKVLEFEGTVKSAIVNPLRRG